jgi:hypothetical protein
MEQWTIVIFQCTLICVRDIYNAHRALLNFQKLVFIEFETLNSKKIEIKAEILRIKD